MNNVRVSPLESMPSLNKPWPKVSRVAQPSRLRVRVASRGVKGRRAGTPAELAGADACATTTGGAR